MGILGVCSAELHPVHRDVVRRDVHALILFPHKDRQRRVLQVRCRRRAGSQAVMCGTHCARGRRPPEHCRCARLEHDTVACVSATRIVVQFTGLEALLSGAFGRRFSHIWVLTRDNRRGAAVTV